MMGAHAVAREVQAAASRSATRPRSVALCGFGTVGRSVAKILCSGRYPELQLTHIFTRNVERRRAGWVPNAVQWLDDIDSVFESGADVLVEVVGGCEPARTWIARALESGRAVVTANKQVVAEFGPELFASARMASQDLRFEAAVAGGVPVIQAIEAGLAGDELLSIAGVLNGTSNYVLTRMEASGLPLDAALREAIALGYAEADPSADIDGLDARAKLAILAMVALRLRVTPSRIAARDIRAIEPADFEQARRLGGAVRQVAMLEPSAHDRRVIMARVGPAIISRASPLARVEGNHNAVAVRGLFSGETVYAGPGAGGDPTAVAVVSDLLAIARGVGSRVPAAFEVPRDVQHELVVPHYVRVPTRGAAAGASGCGALLEILDAHALEATPLNDAGADRRDPAFLVDMCSSAVLDSALAAYTTRLPGAAAVSMPILFREDEPPTFQA